MDDIYNKKEITRRQRVLYNDADKMDISDDKSVILTQIKKNERNGISIIYDNQEECSMIIVAKFHNKKIINIMVVAKTQSGKTGTMCALIKNYLRPDDNLIPIENIYIITGLSSCAWKDQTKFRMPKEMWDRVYHRDNLTRKFVEDIKNKKNVLVIIDEIQIAAKENQTLYNTFNEAGFYNKQYLLRNDIKIVEFSATPDGTIYDLSKWGENAVMYKMEPGENYTGCVDLYKNGRVKQYKNLSCYNKISGRVNDKSVKENFKDLKKDISNFKEPLYHIIRTPNAGMSDVVINNFKKQFGNIKYEKYDRESQVKDINNILKIKPNVHTFIFIKEKLRCAKTLEKKYLGILYERFTNSPDDAVIIQGLLGRLTGYDDNGKSICYTNTGSIERYEDLWNNNFDKNFPWKSKTSKIVNGQLVSSGTFNNPNPDKNIKLPKTVSENTPREYLIYKDEKFVKKVCKILGYHYRTTKNNRKGFKETSLNRKKTVVTLEAAIAKVPTAYGTNKGVITYRTCYPCYKNVKNKNTLHFVIIIRPTTNKEKLKSVYENYPPIQY